MTGKFIYTYDTLNKNSALSVGFRLNDTSSYPMLCTRITDNYFLAASYCAKSNMFRISEINNGAIKHIAGTVTALDLDVWHRISMFVFGDKVAANINGKHNIACSVFGDIVDGKSGVCIGTKKSRNLDIRGFETRDRFPGNSRMIYGEKFSFFNNKLRHPHLGDVFYLRNGSINIVRN